MYFPEIYSLDVEDTLGVESSEKAKFGEKHECLDHKYIGRFGGRPIATHDLSRKKAVHSTVLTQRVQKNHRKKMLAAKTPKGRIVQSDFSAKICAKDLNVYRISQPRGSKDRHSKVFTSKGPRDRRMRLSVATAIRLYDLQEKLGLDQPSKTVEWLLLKAQPAIRDLALSAYSNTGQGVSTLNSQNLTSLQKSVGGFDQLDLYGNVLAANSFPASTTESNSISNIDAKMGETSAMVSKRRRRYIANPSERKAHRTQARERARQRTREKCRHYQSQSLIDHLKAYGFLKDSLSGNVNGNNYSPVKDSIHLAGSNSQSEIQSSLNTNVQNEGSSLQFIGSFSCSNPATETGQGYFPLCIPCSCCAQCCSGLGLECISEGQSSSNKETLQIVETTNICPNHSSNILAEFSPVSCFPSPPYHLLDAGYYAHDYCQ